MTEMTPEQRLRASNIQLPARRDPIANYLSWRRSGNLLFLAGHGPRDAHGVLSTGRLGDTCTLERGIDDARQVGLHILATVRDAVGSLDQVRAVIKLLGLVNAAPSFKDHPRVINGCSDVLVEVLGERGLHARSAFGVASLPGGMTVEIEAIIEVFLDAPLPAPDD